MSIQHNLATQHNGCMVFGSAIKMQILSIVIPWEVIFSRELIWLYILIDSVFVSDPLFLKHSTP